MDSATYRFALKKWRPMLNSLNKITYIEDEPDIRAITEIALTQIGGFHLDVCVSGAEAIARTSDFGPDLIILDVMMPGMDGVETYTRLRQIPSLVDTPIIFMTAKAMTDEVAQYRAMGALDVIAKPFDPMTLSHRIETIWREHSARLDPSMQGQLRALIKRHCITLAEQVATIGRLLAESRCDEKRNSIARAQSVTHQIKGTAGSIGFAAVSSAAEELDDILKLLAQEPTASTEQMLVVRELFARLKELSHGAKPELSTLYSK